MLRVHKSMRDARVSVVPFELHINDDTPNRR